MKLQGLIPAHAGKTWPGDPCFPPREAHPRSRGENFWLSSHWRSAGGSSPLTRGKRDGREAAGGRFRLIPAHAGKTPCQVRRASWSRAHPRSRGENPKTRSDRLLDPGSSPLTRGKLHCLVQRGLVVRLIPAHAGKTMRDLHHIVGWGAHPRSRGENVPPLTRGKLGLSVSFGLL